jgi:hypothetical protein
MNLNTNTTYLQFCKNCSSHERIIVCGFACKDWTRIRMTIHTSSIQYSESECNAGAMNNIISATGRQFAFHKFSWIQLTTNDCSQEGEKKISSE